MTATDSDLLLMLAARRTLAAVLSAALSDPFDLRQPRAVPAIAPEALRGVWAGFEHLYQDVKQGDLGLGELKPSKVSIEPLIDWLSMDLPTRCEVWQRVFGLVISKVCPPYETEYCHWKDPTYRAQQLADIAGFYAAFKFEPRLRLAERQDHVAAELLFLQLVLDRWHYAIEHRLDDAMAQVCADAAGAFLRDHMTWWMPTFGRCLERRIEPLAMDDPDGRLAGGLRALAGVSSVLRAHMAIERLAHGLAPHSEIISPRIVVEDAGDDSCQGCVSEVCAQP